MQENFKRLSDNLFQLLNNQETLMLSLSAENSHFCRLNQSKVRQIGEVQDMQLSLSIINNNRICHGSITLTNNFDTDLEKSSQELNRLKSEVKQLPEDPYLVMPSKADSIIDIIKVQLFIPKDVVESITPIISSVDVAGIWASGNIYRV